MHHLRCKIGCIVRENKDTVLLWACYSQWHKQTLLVTMADINGIKRSKNEGGSSCCKKQEVAVKTKQFFTKFSPPAIFHGLDPKELLCA